jgi:hypothetical protein
LVGPDGEQIRGRFTNTPIQGQDLHDLLDE